MSDKKVIIITGANSGIGLEAAKGLCALGHELIVSVRDDAKGEATIAAVKAEVPEAQITYFTMEMSDPQSIREFVEKFLVTGKPLHVLINNAGLFKPYRSPERFTARDDPALEITMTVNCMGSFLLTQLLLDKMKEAATEESPGRIVNVSSMLTLRPPSKPNSFYIDDLMLAEEGHYVNGMIAYRNSKLAMNLWNRELAGKLKDANVLVNAVCPGFIPNTGLARDNTGSFLGSMAMKLLDSFIGRKLVNTKPVSEGRRKLVEMAVGDHTKTTGLFYSDDKPVDEAAEVLNKENQEKIWALCVKYSGLSTDE